MPDAAHEILPLFVGGTGRSGSTALKNALGRHPKIGTAQSELRIVSGPGGVLDCIETMYSGWDPLRADHAINMLARAWSYVEKRFPNAEKMTPAVKNLIAKLTRTTTSGYARDRVWETPFRETSAITLAEAQTLLLEFFGDVFRNPNWSYGLDDTPYSVLQIHRVHQILPMAKAIAIVRDPKDTLASMIEKKWAPKRWEDCALRIQQVLWQIHDLGDAGKIDALIHLESLVRSPEATLDDLVGRLELEWDAALDDHGISAQNANIGRGARLPPKGLDAYRAHLAEVAEAFGYK